MLALVEAEGWSSLAVLGTPVAPVWPPEWGAVACCLAVLSPPRSATRLWVGLDGGWKLLRFDAKLFPVGAIVGSVRPDIVGSEGAVVVTEGTIADVVDAGAEAGANRFVLGGGKAAVDVALRPVLEGGVSASGLFGGADLTSGGQPGRRRDEKDTPGGTLSGTGSDGDVCGRLGVVADTGTHW